MKILLINYRYFVSGGPERYMFNLKALLEDKGHEVIPFSIRYTKNEASEYSRYFVSPLSDENEVYFKEQSWSISSVKKSIERVFYSKEVVDSLTELIRTEKPDYAIVLHYLRKLSPSVLHALQREKVPFVVRISDFALICPQAHLFRDQQICEKCISKGLFQSVKHGCVQNSRAISFLNYSSLLFQKSMGFFRNIPYLVIPSAFTLLKYRQAGWNPGRMVHVRTFVTEIAEQPSPVKLKQIVYIGRVEYLKGIHILLEAVAYLKEKKHFDIPVKIIGSVDKEYFEIHSKFCRDHNLDNVTFVPFLQKADLLKVLAESYASVAPSLWYDNMPNSVLESLSVGTPVIASNHGSLTELISEGANGFLFEPGNFVDLADKILELFADDTRYSAMCQNAIEYTRAKHGAESHYEALMGLYRRQVSPPVRASSNRATREKQNALLVNTYHYLRGGDCTYTFTLKDLLKKNGFNVIDFGMRHPQNLHSDYESYFTDYIDFRELNSSKNLLDGLRVLNRSIFSLHAKNKIARLLDNYPPDIAHIQNFHGHLTPSVLVELKKRQIPVVMTLHDYKFLCPNTHFLSHGRICEACKGGKFYQCTVKSCKKGSTLASVVASLEAYIHGTMKFSGYIDHYIAPSEFLRNKFIEFGWDPNRLSVVNNFLEAAQFEETHEPVENYLLFVGQIETWKGIQTLVDTASNLPAHLKIKFAGTGQMLDHFRKISEKFSNLEFCGHLDKQALKRLTHSAYFIIQPSAWYENYPYSIMEAMALGKPIIASRIGGLPEMVHHGVNGYLFEAGDSTTLSDIIRNLPHKDSEEYHTLCANSFALAKEKFSPESFYGRIEKIYEQVMEK